MDTTARQPTYEASRVDTFFLCLCSIQKDFWTHFPTGDTKEDAGYNSCSKVWPSGSEGQEPAPTASFLCPRSSVWCLVWSHHRSTHSTLVNEASLPPLLKGCCSERQSNLAASIQRVKRNGFLLLFHWPPHLKQVGRRQKQGRGPEDSGSA